MPMNCTSDVEMSSTGMIGFRFVTLADMLSARSLVVFAIANLHTL